MKITVYVRDGDRPLEFIKVENDGIVKDIIKGMPRPIQGDLVLREMRLSPSQTLMEVGIGDGSILDVRLPDYKIMDFLDNFHCRKMKPSEFVRQQSELHGGNYLGIYVTIPEVNVWSMSKKIHFCPLCIIEKLDPDMVRTMQKVKGDVRVGIVINSEYRNPCSRCSRCYKPMGLRGFDETARDYLLLTA